MYNTKTITLDGERITVTKHAENDFDIFFADGDFSVRGTMLDVVKTFAEWQWSEMAEPAVSFEYGDQAISNPWIDPSARFPLSDLKACDTYGTDNVLQFIFDSCDLLTPYM